MPLPQPKVALTDACSVIFDGTLYTYSADAFQSLPLEPGARWTQLPQGEKVTGGVCVGSTPGDASTAAFFVVGGKGTSDGYQGLQKFTYATGKWESVELPMPVTQDRLWHGATYINSTDSILMYGGAQDGSQHPSQQTFTIGASAPYTVLSFNSVAPPTINPILLSWSATEAVLIGGSTWNTKITIFRQPDWIDSGASLAEPLQKDVSAIKAVIINGDDGSRSLLTFDMTVSPNSVHRSVLFSAGDVPVVNSPAIKRRTSGGGHRSLESARRDATPLTVANWPDYNSTLAPKVTRSNYALAQDPNGLVVIAGGNQDDILCMFDARENSWQNATAKLVDQKLLASEASSTQSSQTATSTATTRPTTSPTSAAASITAPVAATQTPAATTLPAASETSGSGTTTILAAALGSIFGLAIVLAGLYWCIHRRRRRNAHIEAGHMRRASGASSDEKAGVKFANDSLPQINSGLGVFRGHQQQDSQGSFSSIAILMGRHNQQKPGQSAPMRNLSSNTNHSRRSSEDSTFRAFKSTISKPMPQVAETARTITPPPARQPARDDKGVSFAPNTTEPRPRNPSAAAAIDRQGSMRRSSGWNRYWSGGSALNLLGFGNGANANNRNSNTNNANGGANQASRRNTVASDRSSNYSNQHRITQDSATVPPLHINEPRASFSRVAARSPNIAMYNAEIKEGMTGQIEMERPVSAVSSVSGYSSGIPASVHEAWDPTEFAFPKPWGADRAPASTYTGTDAASSAPSSQLARQQQAVRDDMSWLNLGDGR
ncbi:hypothetical protein B0T26DRAFT_657933 [Lasiosphaeria miniovina]|uniref:Pre-mRNA splicing factor CLF1 n=1 Tax=Lasiosphaeria miniovina TaxID=1954250 RepID=A0AA39ZUI3_9PEZI|nr:uncharacterized protein B0T26DRAFT_657933 [Lasiosphaeria miniovina]KAK0703800.1 hypothetical protein B0T26DRAFT_657933 [Lasiosphaeria miniovina]